MSLTAFILITISAFFHALWNLIGKQQNPSISFFLYALAGSALLLSPVLIVYAEIFFFFPLALWKLVLATAVAQSLYFLGLAGAYRRGDVSLVYPLARAIPVVAVAAYNLAIGRGYQITSVALGGMALVALGCFLAPMENFRDLTIRNYFNLRSLFILTAAFGTTAYTIVDDSALLILREHPDIGLSAGRAALVHITLQTFATVPLMILAALCFSKTPRRDLCLTKQEFLYSLLTGLLLTCTYLLVLASMAFVSNVSYVAAFRPLSIPIAAVAGMLLFKEPAPRPKLCGLALLLTGLVMILL